DTFNAITTEMPPLKPGAAFPPPLDRLRLIAEDADDPDDLVPPELDLLKTYAGYDDEYLYLAQSVQGNLESGMLTNPPAPCLYFTALINMDDKTIDTFTDAPMLVYSPMGRMFNLPTFGLTRAEKLLRDPKSAFSPEAGVQWAADKAAGSPTMYFKVKR